MSHDVFISYSHRDQKVADAACARLEQAGHRCWIAPRDVGAGEWGKAIVEGIRGARVFVLIFSAHANRSPQVNREVERAVSGGLPIIPVRVEDVKPSDSLEYFISNQHWLDALTAPLARHLDRLAEMVGRLLDAPAASPVAPVAEPRRRVPVALTLMALFLIAVAAAVFFTLRIPAQDEPVNDVQPENVQVANSVAPAPAPAPRDEELLDFASIPVEESQSPEADQFLRNARIPVRLIGQDPPGTGLEFSRSDNFSDAIAGPTRNLLLFRRGPPPSPGVSVNRLAIVLEFEEPVASIRFRLPAFVGPNVLSVLSATALGGSGEVIDRGSIGPEGPMYSAAGRTITLSAWRGEGIRRVRLEAIFFGEEPDPAGAPRPRLYSLIEGITIRRMPAPAT